jgi:hypothetical protein
MKLEALHSNVRYVAILRDMDSRLLANGEARIYISEARGFFWPRDAAIIHTILVREAMIEIPKLDLILKVYQLKACESKSHFDLDLSPAHI